MLNLAIVGVVFWGPHFARHFSMQDDVNLVAVCDFEGRKNGRVRHESADAKIKIYDKGTDSKNVSEHMDTSGHFGKSRMIHGAGNLPIR